VITAIRINDQHVARVRRVAWHPNDPRDLRGVDQPTLIGRCHVELADGSVVVAPLFAYTDERRLGQAFALVFNVATGTFATIPFDKEA
jgi:hypothetical protein